jgi:hypothetical protein
MSWVGNVIAAVGAIKIGKYNKKLFDEQSKLTVNETNRKRAVYNNIDKPRLIKDQNRADSELLVSLLSSGVEVRPGTTPYLVRLESRINQATDLAIADYNETTAYQAGYNNASLLTAKGNVAQMQGYMTAIGEGAKAISGAQKNKRDTGSILG